MGITRRDLKMSFNPTLRNKEVLDLAKSNSRLPLTEIIGLSDKVKKTLLSLIDSEIQELQNQLENLSYNDIRRDDVKSKLNEWYGLRDIVTNYLRHADDNDDGMQHVDLKQGYLRCPSDWLLVNPDDAPNSTRAYVMECHEGSRYGIPHYVYFDELKELNESFTNMVTNAILQAYPDFQRVIDMQVEPEYEPGKPQSYAYIVNKVEYFASPWIGVFPIKTHAEVLQWRQYDPTYNPPAGAEIIR